MSWKNSNRSADKGGFPSFPYIETFAYSWYLKRILGVSYIPGPPRRVLILNDEFSERRLERELDIKSPIRNSEQFNRTVFEWIRKENQFTKKKTLDDIYLIFKSKAKEQNIDIKSYDDFIRNKKNLAPYIETYYERYILAHERTKFSSIHVYAYLGYYRDIINDKGSNSQDKNKAANLLLLLAIDLSRTPNTTSKNSFLRTFKNEINTIRSKNIGNTYIETKLSDATNELSDYLSRNPIPKAYSILTSKPILFFGISILSTVLVAAYFFIALNEKSDIPSCLTVPILEVTPSRTSQNSPIIDSSLYWYNKAATSQDDPSKLVFLDSAIAHEENFEEAYFFRGILNQKINGDKNDTRAMEDIKKALGPPLSNEAENKRNPYNNYLYYPTDLEKKLYECREQIQNNPNDTSAYLSRALTEMAVGMFEEAIADLDTVVTLDSTNAWAYKVRADARKLLSDINGAIYDYTLAIYFTQYSRFPDDPFFLGQFYMDRSIALKMRAQSLFYPLPSIMYLDTMNDSLQNIYCCALTAYYQSLEDRQMASSKDRSIKVLSKEELEEYSFE